MSNSFKGYENDDDERDFLVHYGTPRHSGRYPWGSGKKPQRSKNFVSRVDYYRYKGFKDTDIAKMEGISTTEFRKRLSIARTESRRADIAMAQRLRDKGMSNVAIGERMGHNESYVRTLLKEGAAIKADRLNTTTDILKNSVDSKKYIDVGSAVNSYVGVSKNTFDNAVKKLTDSGEYEKIQVNVKQIANPLQYTNVDVLVKKGTPKSEIYDHLDKVSLPVEYFVDKNDPSSRQKINPPVNVNSKRVMAVYAEDGGTERDGLIELRRGVPDLDLGNSRYAQVRIGIDGTHYAKGMAVYADDLPDGIDIRFNTSKHVGTPLYGTDNDKSVFKKQKSDPDNPFGASIDRQNYYKNEKGERTQGALNIVQEEGKWGDWKKSLAAQMLSKQPIELAKKQLKLAQAESDEEFETIKNLTNPVLKKQLLLQFADNCDSDAVDLKAAALPRQASHVILPVPSLKGKEIYAPNYEDGEEVALIRYPHGGVFEIPRLKVNNRNREAIRMMGKNPIDAVGINSKTAEQLSGADFDGDTVLVIPTKGVKIKTHDPYKELQDFDPKTQYHQHEGMRVMTSKMKGKEMGSITNLITDMTLLGADEHEIIRAVKHSMVIVDAEKHKLDFEQSYIDNGIAELKTKYQGGPTKGASTLISKSTSEQRVANRTKSNHIDPETGERVSWIDPKTGKINWNYKRELYVKRNSKGEPMLDSDGNPRMEERKPLSSTKMYETDDAFTLSSGHPMENVYAEYANHMKDLGNKARKESLNVGTPKWNRGATTLAYKDEIMSLDEKLDKARRNAPLERRAQMIANQNLKTKLADNPDIKDDGDALKKLKNNLLRDAREITGAGKEQIKFTDREWEAIQAGAISATKQEEIFKNCDLDMLKSRAMPRDTGTITPATKNRIAAMLDSGWTTKELAEKFGVSTSTISKIKKEGV